MFLLVAEEPCARLATRGTGYTLSSIIARAAAVVALKCGFGYGFSLHPRYNPGVIGDPIALDGSGITAAVVPSV